MPAQERGHDAGSVMYLGHVFPGWILIHMIDGDVLAISQDEVIGSHLGDVGGAHSDPTGNIITSNLAIGGSADLRPTLINDQRRPLDSKVKSIGCASSYREGTGVKGRGCTPYAFCDKHIIRRRTPNFCAVIVLITVLDTGVEVQTVAGVVVNAEYYVGGNHIVGGPIWSGVVPIRMVNTRGGSPESSAGDG